MAARDMVGGSDRLEVIGKERQKTMRQKIGVRKKPYRLFS